MWEELSSIQVVPSTVEDLLAEKETNRVIDFLMGLNANYENVRSRILMKKTLPTLSEVYNILDQEESQKSAISSLEGELNTATFQVSQGSVKSFQSSGGSYMRKDRP